MHEGYLGQEPYTEVVGYGVEADDEELRLTDCVFWQPDPGPAASGGGPVRYQYSVSHPYAATLTKVPSGGDGDGVGGFTILIVASPVTETACVVWRSTVVDDAGADLDAQQAFNELIFSQDIDVVESQRPGGCRPTRGWSRTRRPTRAASPIADGCAPEASGMAP